MIGKLKEVVRQFRAATAAQTENPREAASLRQNAIKFADDTFYDLSKLNTDIKDELQEPLEKLATAFLSALQIVKSRAEDDIDSLLDLRSAAQSAVGAHNWPNKGALQSQLDRIRKESSKTHPEKQKPKSSTNTSMKPPKSHDLDDDLPSQDDSDEPDGDEDDDDNESGSDNQGENLNDIVAELEQRIHAQRDNLEEAKKSSTLDIGEIRQLLTSYTLESSRMLGGQVTELLNRIGALIQANEALSQENQRLKSFCEVLQKENAKYNKNDSPPRNGGFGSAPSSAPRVDLGGSGDLDLNLDDDESTMVTESPRHPPAAPIFAGSPATPPPQVSPAASAIPAVHMPHLGSGMPGFIWYQHLFPGMVPPQWGHGMAMQPPPQQQPLPIPIPMAQPQQQQKVKKSKHKTKKRKRRSSSDESSSSPSNSSSSDDETSSIINGNNDDDDDEVDEKKPVPVLRPAKRPKKSIPPPPPTTTTTSLNHVKKEKSTIRVAVNTAPDIQDLKIVVVPDPPKPPKKNILDRLN